MIGLSLMAKGRWCGICRRLHPTGTAEVVPSKPRPLCLSIDHWPIIEENRAQLVWQANWVEVHPDRHAPFAVAFNWGATKFELAGTCRGVGSTQLVWQFADCELQDIVQFATVDVTGVESP